MPIINCPHCDHEQSVPRELVGLRATCRECKEEFTVDDGAGASGKLTKRRIDFEPVNVGSWIKSVKLLAGLVVLVGIVFGIAYFVISAKRNADKEREPAKNALVKPPPKIVNEQPVNDAQQSREVKAVIGSGILLAIIVGVTIYTLLVFVTGAWIAKDANARGMPGLGWAAFYYLSHLLSRFLLFGFTVVMLFMLNIFSDVAFIASGIRIVFLITVEGVSWMGLFAYLYARRHGRPTPCRDCGNHRLHYLAKCPHCSK